MKELFKFLPGSIDIGYIIAAIAGGVGIGIAIYSVIVNQNNTSLALGLVGFGVAAHAATNFTNRPKDGGITP